MCEGGEAAGQSPVAGAHQIPQMAEGARLNLPNSFHSGGYSGTRDFGSFNVQLFEARIGSETASQWIPWAVRLSGSVADTQVKAWADGRTCPALYGVAKEFSMLATPQFRLPRFYDLPVGAGGMGGPGSEVGAPPVAVWGYARQADGAMMGLMFTGADGLLPAWVNYAEQALESCWKADVPDWKSVE